MIRVEGQKSALPDVDVLFYDGALGRIPATGDGIAIAVGVKDASGTATANQVYRLFLPNDYEKAIELFGGTFADKLLDAVSNGQGIVYAISAASNTSDDILTAIETAVEQSLVNGDALFEYIAVLTPVDKTLATSIESYLSSLVSRHIYVWAIVEARDKNPDPTVEPDYDTYVTNLINEWSGFSALRTFVVAAYATFTNIKGNQGHRNGLGSIMGLISRAKVSQDIGEVGAFSIKNLVSLPDGLTYSHIYTLDQAGFITIRTYDGYAGYYVTNPVAMNDPTSDYHFMYARRVADKAAKLSRKAVMKYLKGEILPPNNQDPSNPVKPTKSPTVQELKAKIEHTLKVGMYDRKELYGYRVYIPEGQDIWASRELNIYTKLIPTPHMDWIEIHQSFENPLLEIGG